MIDDFIKLSNDEGIFCQVYDDLKHIECSDPLLCVWVKKEDLESFLNTCYGNGLVVKVLFDFSNKEEEQNG